MGPQKCFDSCSESRDPRWQKKRLEIMQRDEFSCRKCGNDQATLNVHHTFYSPGRDPWDYPDASLVTLCELGWTRWLRQPNKTLFAVRCKLLDRQDHCTAF